VRVVIVGAGEVGFTAADLLSREGHKVVVVEQNERLVERASERLDALALHGNGASPKILSEAGVKKSDLLVAATSSDEVNIIACLAAKAQGVPKTIARIHNPEYHDAGEPFVREMFGIDSVIHTEQMAAEAIRDAVVVPGAVNVETFAGESIEVAEVILDPASPAVGLPLREVRLPHRSLVIGLVREGEALVPRGDTVLKGRDHVFLIGERKRMPEVIGAVATDTAPVREVMIFGGGRVGLRLAQALGDAGISVKVVEQDEERARYVAARLRRGIVLHGDGVSQDLLQQERADKTDAFVAVTGDDRTNLLAAMYARRLGARLTIAGVSRGEFTPLAEALGVDITISPRVLAASAVLRFVRRGDVVAVTLLESGAEMMELRVPDRCRVVGRPLSEVGFPEGALVGAILRDGEVVVPSGKEVLRPGDDAVVFSLRSAVNRVERLFTR